MTHPTDLGRYRIVGILGRGGMGVVYDAYDPQIERPVAIKTIALEGLDDRDAQRFEMRFRAEMRSAGRLQHQNIAALYDTGRDGGTAYIVMERVAGHDLKWHLSSGARFGIAQVLDIAAQLLAALEFAHRRQIIHRDVKPANVMLQPDGVVKLCDFGVARLAEADATRTQGMVVGSLRYASPEQITGQEVDARTDLFSAGVLLFELLTGRLPFPGRSDVEILHRVATDPTAPSPRLIEPSIPPQIDAAVQRALARDRAHRFASAAEFAQALGVPLAAAGDTRTLPWHPPQPAAPAPPASAARSRRWPAVAAAGAALALLAGGAWYVASTPADPAEPAAAAAGAGAAARMSAAAPVVSGNVAQRPPLPPSVAPSALLPQTGSWRGQLDCAAIVGGAPTAAARPFRASLQISIDGTRIGWKRETDTVVSRVDGRFDAAGRFRAEGAGSRKDRAERWTERAEGRYDAAGGRIEGRLVLLRPKDGSVARECAMWAVPLEGGAAPAGGAPAGAARRAAAALPAGPPPAMRP